LYGSVPLWVDASGTPVVEKLYSKYGDSPEQEALTKRGNSYLKSSFPLLDYIKTATIL